MSLLMHLRGFKPAQLQKLANNFEILVIKRIGIMLSRL